MKRAPWSLNLTTTATMVGGTYLLWMHNWFVQYANQADICRLRVFVSIFVANLALLGSTFLFGGKKHFNGLDRARPPSLKQRFYEHFMDASHKDTSKPCGRHFSLPGHSEANINVIGIEQVLPKNDTLL